MIDRTEAERLRDMGCTYQQIAVRYGVTKQAVHQLLKYVPTGKPPGRPRLLMSQEAAERRARYLREWRAKRRARGEA